MKISKHTELINKNGVLYLKDYNSFVASYNIYFAYFKLGKKWNYSVTTLKSIINFIAEFVEVPEIRKINKEEDKKKYIETLIKNKIVLVDNLEEEFYK